MIKKMGKKFFEILTKISPKLSAIILYIYRTKEIPHLKNPQNFNEKMTNLKLSYKDDKLVSRCADKYEVRDYVKSKGLENILNELYFVCNTPEEIDFEKLPNKFVLKCTHGSGYNIVCKNKTNIDINDTKKKLKKWLKERYGLATTELQYLKIKPKIICEKYLCDENDRLPIDYKFYCIAGKVEGVLVCTERDLETHTKKVNFFDLQWKELPYIKEKDRSKTKVKKPENFELMVEYAKKLSKDFKFVRVDLYNDNGKIIFGELTFTPDCCCVLFHSKQGNIELGRNLNV